MTRYDQNKLLVSTIIEACKSGDDVHLRKIIERDPNCLNVRDQNGRTLLHYCAEHQTSSCADLLLSKWPQLLMAQDDDGYTVLHLLAICGNAALLKFVARKANELLQGDGYGDFLDCCDHENHTALHWATVCGELECLVALHEMGASASVADIHGAQPIHYSAQSGNYGSSKEAGLRILKELLQLSPDAKDSRDRDGRTPLLWAASSANNDAIMTLVNYKADVSMQDRDGLTAIHCAASRGFVECLDTLICLCGAEVDQMDSNGCSALFYSVTLGHADCTQFLLQNGAEANRQDRKGRTSAHCGAAKGQLETIKILAQHSANLWMRNIRGDLPLHEAVRSGRKELVRWLLEQSPSTVNVTNTFGRTPLHIACMTNNVEMCKVLIDTGSDVNAIMKSKGSLMTPLDAALQRGYRSCAKFLLLHGALPSSKLNGSGTRPNVQRFSSKSPNDGDGPGDRERSSREENRQQSNSVSLSFQTESSQSTTLHEVRVPSSMVSHRSRTAGQQFRAASVQKVQVFNGSESPYTCVTTTAMEPDLKTQSIVTNVYVTTGPVAGSGGGGRKRTTLKRVKRKKVLKSRTVKSPDNGADDQFDEVRDQTRLADSERLDGSGGLDISGAQSPQENSVDVAPSNEVLDSLVSKELTDLRPKSRSLRDFRHVKSERGNEEPHVEAEQYIIDQSTKDRESPKRELEDDTNVTDRNEEKNALEKRASVCSITINYVQEEEGEEEREEEEVATDNLEASKNAIEAAGQLNATEKVNLDLDDPDARQENDDQSIVGWEFRDGNNNDETIRTTVDEYVRNVIEEVVEQLDEVNDKDKVATSVPEEYAPSEGVAQLESEDVVKIEEVHHSYDNDNEQVQLKRGKRHISQESGDQGLANGDLNNPDENEAEKNEEFESNRDTSKVGEGKEKEEATKLGQNKELEIEQNDSMHNDQVIEKNEEEAPEISGGDRAEEKEAEGAKTAEPALDHLDVHQREDMRTDTTLANVPDITDDEKGPDGEHELCSCDSPVAVDRIEGKSKLSKKASEQRDFDQVSEADTCHELPSIGSDNSLQGSVSVMDDDGEEEEVGEGEIAKETVHLKPGEQFRSATTFEFRAVDEDNENSSNEDFTVMSNDNKRKTKTRADSRCNHKLHFKQSVSGIGPIDVRHVTAKINTRSNVISKCRQEIHVKSRWTESGDAAFAHLEPSTMTQDIEKTSRKYHTERKLFEELQELKRCQIRSNRSHEALLVKRLVDKFERETRVPGLSNFSGPYNYKNYEKFLYDQLRKLSRSNRGKVIRSNSEENLTSKSNDFLSVELHRRGSRSVTNMVSNYDIYQLETSEDIKEEETVEDCAETIAGGPSSAPQDTANVMKRVSDPRQVKSDKAPKTLHVQTLLHKRHSSGSSSGSASRIPILRNKRPSGAAVKSSSISVKAIPRKQRRKWQKPCCQNIEPIVPLDAAINRPVFRRAKMSIPPKPQFAVDDKAISERWSEVKKQKQHQRCHSQDSSLRKTTSSPQLNSNCTLLYEINLHAKDKLFGKSFSAIDPRIQRQGSMQRTLSESALN